jgi:hypothetical protein
MVQVSFGDNVRINSTPETEALGVAGRIGQVYGYPTPSVTGVAVIGDAGGDYAINVYFGKSTSAAAKTRCGSLPKWFSLSTMLPVLKSPLELSRRSAMPRVTG